MPLIELKFTVPGKPASQGSLTTFRSKTTGKLITPQNKRVVEWRNVVGMYAMNAMRDTDAYMTKGPVVVRGDFYFARPKKHFRTGRFSDQLKACAPGVEDHIQKPDVDKLMRAVLDALTGIVYKDDSQVTMQIGQKYWAETDYASIKVFWRIP